MSGSRLSVLFPVRNGLPYLHQAIASIEEQTLVDFGVAVVDDGSEDGSRAVLDAWAARDRRVRVIEGGSPSTPLGIVRALGKARATVDGRYLARMDADDVTPRDRFERQVDYLESNPSVSLCGTAVRYIPREALTGGARAYERWINSLETPEETVRDLFVECPIAHPTFLMRASALDAVGGYVNGPWPEDYDLVLRLWESGRSFANVSGDAHAWRDHLERSSRTDPRYSIDSFQSLKTAVLARSVLAGRPLVIWGAGPTGKSFAKKMARAGHPPAAFVELDPRKIGQTIHGAPVLSPDALGSPAGRFGLGAVSGAAARGEIRAAFEARGWRELVDFVAVA